MRVSTSISVRSSWPYNSSSCSPHHNSNSSSFTNLPVEAGGLMSTQIILLYTVGRKKRATLFWTITPMFRGGFWHFLYQWKQKWILYRGVTKFITLSQLCLHTTWWNQIRIKQHILKWIVTVFYYSTTRMSLWAKWADFFTSLFKTSAFCTDTRCQPMSPLFSYSSVNNVLL